MNYKLIAIIVGIIILAGIVFVTVIAWISPARLADEEDNFRYDLAALLVFGWPLSLIYFLLWSLTWPARRLVARNAKMSHRAAV